MRIFMCLMTTMALFLITTVSLVRAEPCDEAYKDLKSIEGNEKELLARAAKYPDCGKLYSKLGDYYLSKKTWEDAKKSYEKALSFFPDSDYIQDQLAEIAKSIPIKLDANSKLDLAGEVKTRGLGGTKKLPPIAMEVHFDTGSATISSKDAPTLDNFAGVVKNGFTNYSFEIQGHTDSTGGDKENQSLSERRAAAVRDYLVKKHGIDASKLSAKGYGTSTPIASNETPEGRTQNRRVQFQGQQ